MYKARSQQKPGHRFRKPGLIIIAALAVVGITAVILETTGVTDVVNSRRSKQYVTTPASENRTINENTKGETNSEGDDQSGQTSPGPSQSNNDKDQATTDVNTPLTTPTGSFVSNHNPNLSGSPAPNSMQSTCTTTPGAKCQITFKLGSTTKSLPAQQTDRGGSAYWSWELQDIGLTEGSWEVTAKATLGSQTKTATDSMKLEIKP
jgi:hypothetical protein